LAPEPNREPTNRDVSHTELDPACESADHPIQPHDVVRGDHLVIPDTEEVTGSIPVPPTRSTSENCPTRPAIQSLGGLSGDYRRDLWPAMGKAKPCLPLPPPEMHARSAADGPARDGASNAVRPGVARPARQLARRVASPKSLSSHSSKWCLAMTRREPAFFDRSPLCQARLRHSPPDIY
jgi:hypothetical protein